MLWQEVDYWFKILQAGIFTWAWFLCRGKTWKSVILGALVTEQMFITCSLDAIIMSRSGKRTLLFLSAISFGLFYVIVFFEFVQIDHIEVIIWGQPLTPKGLATSAVLNLFILTSFMCIQACTTRNRSYELIRMVPLCQDAEEILGWFEEDRQNILDTALSSEHTVANLRALEAKIERDRARRAEEEPSERTGERNHLDVPGGGSGAPPRVRGDSFMSYAESEALTPGRFIPRNSIQQWKVSVTEWEAKKHPVQLG